jgi:chorismate mutase
MEERILHCRSEGDSVGGIVEVLARNVPPGLGDPVFKKLDAEIAGALMSIGGVKAVEIGDGFGVASIRGSENNDQMDQYGFKTNHAGGILGGISTGQDIRVRIAVKPTPSIEKEQDTIDVFGKGRRISIRGKHDPCICPRIVPVAEAMAALVLYDALLRQKDLEGRPVTLERLRHEIDELDHRLIHLLANRNRIAAKVGHYKQERRLDIRDRKREAEVMAKRVGWATDFGMDTELVKKLFLLLMKTSRQIQKQ